MTTKNSVKIAVFGCGHGKLDDMYNKVRQCKSSPPDLVIITGDFQAVRNPKDLECMSVPFKYRQLGDFYKYYSGEVEAPILTLVIGGNHEASNYFNELAYGGWLCPNIYYLGYANVVKFGPVTIGGLSGIYNHGNYLKGYFETLPYNSNHLRSAYHVREFQFLKLKRFQSKIDLVLSHDWPQGIEHFGDLHNLLRFKPWFKKDIDSGELGSPPAMQLLKTLKPTWWLSSHMHCKFEATVSHETEANSALSVKNEDAIDLDDLDSINVTNPIQNEDEIDLDNLDADDLQPQPVKNSDEIDLDNLDTVDNKVVDRQINNKSYHGPSTSNPDAIDLDQSTSPKRFKLPSPQSATKFLALDKCLPKRFYLEYVEIPIEPTDEPLQLTYHPEWLAIVKGFNPITPTHNFTKRVTFRERDMKQAIQFHFESINAQITSGELDMTIPDNFVKRGADMNAWNAMDNETKKNLAMSYINPQTETYCELVGIDNKF